MAEHLIGAEHLRMAYRLTARYVRPGSRNFEDALQTARLALCEVAVRYDPAKGAMFITYAYVRVENALKDFIAAEASADVVLRDGCLESPATAEASPEDQAADRERVTQIRDLSRTLCMAQQHAVSKLLREGRKQQLNSVERAQVSQAKVHLRRRWRPKKDKAT